MPAHSVTTKLPKNAATLRAEFLIHPRAGGGGWGEVAETIRIDTHKQIAPPHK